MTDMNTNSPRVIQWMSYRNIAIGVSLLLILVSLASLFTRGLNLGLDFTGGTVLELKVPSDVTPELMRGHLEANGVENAVVQNFGSSEDIIVRIPGKAEDVSQITEDSGDEMTPADALLVKLVDKWPSIKKESSSFIGPAVGDELRDKSGTAMIFAILLMLAYIWFRFSIKFGLGAIAALVHDVIITLGLFSITGLTVDLTVLAAVLAVVGYSLNDTVVVADRIRENFIEMREGSPEHIVNASITQTIDRTLMTSITTLLVLLALFFLGGESLLSFSSALIVGVLVGTYSSVYIAGSVILAMKTTKEDFMEKPKQELLDDAP